MEDDPLELAFSGSSSAAATASRNHFACRNMTRCDMPAMMRRIPERKGEEGGISRPGTIDGRRGTGAKVHRGSRGHTISECDTQTMQFISVPIRPIDGRTASEETTMEIFESLVGQFLTCDDKVFVAPQYLVAKNSDICPDFVAIDDSGPTREVVVVEVTTGADLTELKKRILDRELRWFAPLRARFDTDVRMIAFIRQDLIDAATKWAAKQDIPRAEVCFFALEDATFSWKYWVTRRANGLPR